MAAPMQWPRPALQHTRHTPRFARTAARNRLSNRQRSITKTRHPLRTAGFKLLVETRGVEPLTSRVRF